MDAISGFWPWFKQLFIDTGLTDDVRIPASLCLVISIIATLGVLYARFINERSNIKTSILSNVKSIMDINSKLAAGQRELMKQSTLLPRKLLELDIMQKDEKNHSNEINKSVESIYDEINKYMEECSLFLIEYTTYTKCGLKNKYMSIQLRCLSISILIMYNAFYEFLNNKYPNIIRDRSLIFNYSLIEIFYRFINRKGYKITNHFFHRDIKKLVKILKKEESKLLR